MKRIILSLTLTLAACEGANADPDARADAQPDATADFDAGVVARPDAAGLDATGPDATGLDAAGLDAAVTRPDAALGSYALPPVNAPLDYQLGGAYPLPPGVRIVSRDREASPATGAYNLCYVNGFQAQQAENPFWLNDHPALLLRDGAGNPVIDVDWDEMLLDVSTAAKRTELAAIVGGWIEQCARDGFDAVEIDNLDSYTRSGERISEDNAIVFMRMLSDVAHANGMAIAQKNSSEIASRRMEMGTDFAVSEECNRYDECGVYTDAYGDHVLVIEYRRVDFTAGCSAFPNLSIVLRDLNLVASGMSGYVFDGC